MHVKCGEIGPGSPACVLVLDTHHFAGLGGQTRVDAHASLNAGLLVRGDDELVVAQRFALPAARVQVQYSSRFGLEAWIAREDPAAMLPWADRVFMQPSPDRAVADARHQARLSRVTRHVGNAQPGKRQAQCRGQFAGERFDLNGQLWGEKPGGVLGGLVRRGPPIDP